MAFSLCIRQMTIKRSLIEFSGVRIKFKVLSILQVLEKVIKLKSGIISKSLQLVLK